MSSDLFAAVMGTPHAGKWRKLDTRSVHITHEQYAVLKAVRDEQWPLNTYALSEVKVLAVDLIPGYLQLQGNRKETHTRPLGSWANESRLYAMVRAGFLHTETKMGCHKTWHLTKLGSKAIVCFRPQSF